MYSGNDRVQQVNALRELAENIAANLGDGTPAELVEFALNNDGRESWGIELPAWFDNHDAMLLERFVSDAVFEAWLSVSYASMLYNVPVSSITLACRNSQIRHAEKRGRDWRFPQASFLAWLKDRPGSGNKKLPDS